MMIKKLCAVLLIASLTTPAARGAFIDASNIGVNWTVMSGEDLTVLIFLTNHASDSLKYAVDLELSLSGSGTLPTIKSIDLRASGAIFADGAQYPNPGRGIGTSNAIRSADLSGDTTTAEGLLAQVVIGTAGVAPGTYTLAPVPEGDGSFTGTKVWDLDFNEIPLTFAPGTITVIPEPSLLALSGIAALALLVFHSRRRRRP